MHSIPIFWFFLLAYKEPWNPWTMPPHLPLSFSLWSLQGLTHTKFLLPISFHSMPSCHPPSLAETSWRSLIPRDPAQRWAGASSSPISLCSWLQPQDQFLVSFICRFTALALFLHHRHKRLTLFCLHHFSLHRYGLSQIPAQWPGLAPAWPPWASFLSFSPSSCSVWQWLSFTILWHHFQAHTGPWSIPFFTLCLS